MGDFRRVFIQTCVVVNRATSVLHINDPGGLFSIRTLLHLESKHASDLLYKLLSILLKHTSQETSVSHPQKTDSPQQLKKEIRVKRLTVCITYIFGYQKLHVLILKIILWILGQRGTDACHRKIRRFRDTQEKTITSATNDSSLNKTSQASKDWKHTVDRCVQG